MKTRTYSICLLAVGWLTATGGTGWAVTNHVDVLAVQELPRLQRLVTSQNLALMGFQSKQEVSIATVSVPGIDVRQVRLGDLREYRPSTNPSQLLQESDLRIYPVTVNGVTRSAITFGKYPSGWKPVSYGYAGLARLLTAARASSAAATGRPLEDFFAVQIRALNVIFLGYFDSDKLFLNPVVSDRTLRLFTGRAGSAEQVFRSLVPAAQQHNGLPR